MNTQTIKKICICFAFVGVITLGLILYRFGPSLDAQMEPRQEMQPAIGAQADLVIGDTITTIPIVPGETLYESLVRASVDRKFSFAGRDYPGLGFFVTEIGGLRDGGGKYLVYFINEVEASVGVSSYVPVDGDTIRWELR